MNDSNSFEQTPLPEAPIEKRSKGMKTLMTCGCGCGVMLLILAIVAVMAYRHYFGPGDQVPTDHMVGEDTVYVLHMDALSQDVGAKEFVAEMMQGLMHMDPTDWDEEDREAYQEFLDSTEDFSMEDMGEVIDIMPSSMTLIVEDNGTELTKSFGLNLSAASKLVKKIVSMVGADDEWPVHTVGDFEIYEPTSEGAAEGADRSFGFVAFQHDTLLISDDLVSMQRVLERTAYDDEPGPPAGSELRADLDTLRERWLISSVLRDSPRLDLPSLFGEMFSTEENTIPMEELAWLESPFGHATTGIGFVGADMTVRIEVSGLTEADIPGIAAGFERLGEQLAESLDAEGLEFLYEVIQGSNSLAINANLPDLQDWMEREISAGPETADELLEVEELSPPTGEL